MYSRLGSSRPLVRSLVFSRTDAVFNSVTILESSKSVLPLEQNDYCRVSHNKELNNNCLVFFVLTDGRKEKKKIPKTCLVSQLLVRNLEI
jgi:hypothetical protein